MQAITTKYIGPTNYKPGRIKATCQAAKITVSWDHALSMEANHDMAALALRVHLGWSGTWIAGALPDGSGNVYVRMPEVSL